MTERNKTQVGGGRGNGKYSVGENDDMM